MNKTSQKKTRQDRTKQDQTRQDKTGQNKTRQESSRQDSRRQDKTRQDKTRRNKERHLRQAGPCLALFVLFVSWVLPCHGVHVHIFSTKAAIVTFGTFRSVLPLQVWEGGVGQSINGRPPPLLDPSWTQKLVQKRAPKIDPLRKLLLGVSWPPRPPSWPQTCQKGCQKETQTGVQNGAKSRPPEKTWKSEFDTFFIMF